MKQKLCVIGEALIDFIPQRKGCDLKDVEGFSRVAGGAPANVAGAVAKLGVPAMVLTQLGKDAFGDHIIESLRGKRHRYFAHPADERIRYLALLRIAARRRQPRF